MKTTLSYFIKTLKFVNDTLLGNKEQEAKDNAEIYNESKIGSKDYDNNGTFIK